MDDRYAPNEDRAIRLCEACEAGVHASDKFCRSCGGRQISSPITEDWEHYETRILQDDPPTPERLSGQIVRALTLSVAGRTAALRKSALRAPDRSRHSPPTLAGHYSAITD